MKDVARFLKYLQQYLLNTIDDITEFATIMRLTPLTLITDGNEIVDEQNPSVQHYRKALIQMIQQQTSFRLAIVEGQHHMLTSIRLWESSDYTMPTNVILLKPHAVEIIGFEHNELDSDKIESLRLQSKQIYIAQDTHIEQDMAGLLTDLLVVKLNDPPALISRR